MDVAYAQGQIAFKTSNYRLYLGENIDTADLVFTTDSPEHFFTEYAKYEFDEIHWVGWDLEVNNTLPSVTHFEYFISMLASFELYWDDQLIGNNGIVSGTKSSEIPGDIETSFIIPANLLQNGSHQQLFKLSNHYRSKGEHLFRHAFIEPYNIKKKYISLNSLIPTLLVSISFFIGLYVLVLFYVDKLNHAYIFLSLSCIALFVFGYSIQWPHLIGYTYNFTMLNDQVSKVSGGSFPLLLFLFYLVKHGYRRYWFLILLLPGIAWILSAVIGALSYYQLYWITGFVLCAVVLLLRLIQHKEYYWWEMIGLVAPIIPLLQDNAALEESIRYIPILLLFILITNLFEIRRRIISGYQYRIRAANLESQLLRKNIQPHFILNSLTSLSEWVDTEPEKSVEFITAMAQEFRIFSEIADQKLIPITTEIELCEHHLEVMHFRMQQQYQLRVEGSLDGLMIPPGILITLIENAFSHNNYAQHNAQFYLSIERKDGKVLVVLMVPHIPHEQSEYTHLGTGMGYDYIKSQLTQAYQQQWQFESHAVGNCWHSTYQLPDTKRA